MFPTEDYRDNGLQQKVEGELDIYLYASMSASQWQPILLAVCWAICSSPWTRSGSQRWTHAGREDALTKPPFIIYWSLVWRQSCILLWIVISGPGLHAGITYFQNTCPCVALMKAGITSAFNKLLHVFSGYWARELRLHPRLGRCFLALTPINYSPWVWVIPQNPMKT